jgi:acetoin utilization deacetylase AcuC-like enzyme
MFDPFFTLHDVRNGPEVASRLGAVEAGLIEAGIMDWLVRIPPRDATESEICRVHSQAYFRQVRQDVLFGSGELSTGDTELSEYTLEVALRAVGGVLAAVDAVMQRDVTNAFCAVRPPGHHATPVQGMGFCIFNHVAIAARYAQKEHGVGRVLIVDWDVHHGNGTQDAFYDDPSVLFYSSHQHPLFPGTGKRREKGVGKGKGYTVNSPLRAGARVGDLLGEMRKHLVPLLPKFKPELVLISAGFDAHRDDPIGSFRLDADDFAKLTREVMEWADEYADGRIVSVLEGGYNMQALGRSVAAHVAALASMDDE